MKQIYPWQIKFIIANFILISILIFLIEAFPFLLILSGGMKKNVEYFSLIYIFIVLISILIFSIPHLIIGYIIKNILQFRQKGRKYALIIMTIIILLTGHDILREILFSEYIDYNTFFMILCILLSNIYSSYYLLLAQTKELFT